MNISLTLSFASDMFGAKTIERKAICTLDNGDRVRITFYVNPQRGVAFREVLERELVKKFNESQPNMVHKLTKVHLMRN